MAYLPPFHAPEHWTSWCRRQLVSLAPAALALAVASMAMLLGWRGVDQAAQTYRVAQYELHGLMLWDSGWYAGNFPFGYSVLFPPVAALLGLRVVAVASAVVATWSFDRMIRTYFGTRPLGTWYFAVSTLLPVTIGQWPFLAGEAAGMLALVSLQRGRRSLAVVTGIVSALFSPLAAAFLVMGCLAWAAYSTRRRWVIATAAVTMVVVLLLGAVFPGTGPFPFPWTGLVPSELLCLVVMTPLVRTTPAVRLAALLYAAASLFSFVVANPLGGNAPRLAESVGVPLLLCFLTAPGPALDRLSHSSVVAWLERSRGRILSLPGRWRYAAVVVIVPFAVWQWAPWDGIITSPTSSGFTQASFYRPLVGEIDRLAASLPVRVEVTPTLDHWESAFVAPYIPIARGWERQLDIGDNPIFYTPGALTPGSYAQWLDQEGISYVALPTAPLDYAAKAEGALLESGLVANLSLVWTSPNWKLWRVEGSPGLVSGPGRLTQLEPDHFTVVASAPGAIEVRVRYTRFWSVASGQACVAGEPIQHPAGITAALSGSAPSGATGPQWTEIRALTAGPIHVSATVIPASPPAACSR